MPFRTRETPAAQPAGPAPITTTGGRRARGSIGADLTLPHLFLPPNRPMMPPLDSYVQRAQRFSAARRARRGVRELREKQPNVEAQDITILLSRRKVA
jgi:hypothetical protein